MLLEDGAGEDDGAEAGVADDAAGPAEADGDADVLSTVLLLVEPAGPAPLGFALDAAVVVVPPGWCASKSLWSFSRPLTTACWKRLLPASV